MDTLALSYISGVGAENKLERNSRQSWEKLARICPGIHRNTSNSTPIKVESSVTLGGGELHSRPNCDRRSSVTL